MSQSLRPLETSGLYSESVAKPCKAHKNYSQPSSSQAICKRKVLSFQPRQKDELPCVYSKPVSSAIRGLCSSCAYLNCFFGNFFWIENVIPYSPFYNPPFQAHVSCVGEKLTKPHLPRSAQATNVPHNHWRYRTAPTGSATHQPWHQNVWFIVHWSLVSKLPNSKLKYCCCNKTGKQKELPKRSHAPKIKWKQLSIRDSYTFWVSNIFDSIQEVRKTWHTLGSFSFAATCKASLKRWFSTCGLLSSWSQVVFQKQTSTVLLYIPKLNLSNNHVFARFTKGNLANLQY